MNLPAPSVIGRYWYLLADVPGYYGKPEVACSMAIYLGIKRDEHYIYHVFLNGRERYYGHTDAGAYRKYTIQDALSQAWENYMVPPDKWNIADATAGDITNPAHRAVFERFLNELRDVVMRHRSGEAVIPRPHVFHSFYRKYFNAYEMVRPAAP